MQEGATVKPYQPALWVQRLIRGYQTLLSPIVGRRCRYLPTCSEYAVEALRKYGVFKGVVLSVRRCGL